MTLKHGERYLLKSLQAGVSSGKANGNGKRDEEVVMKATSKAIEMALRQAVWWQSQEGVKVVVRTGSVGAVDDVLDAEGDEDGSRLRRVSCVEVGVRLV